MELPTTRVTGEQPVTRVTGEQPVTRVTGEQLSPAHNIVPGEDLQEIRLSRFSGRESGPSSLERDRDHDAEERASRRTTFWGEERMDLDDELAGDFELSFPKIKEKDRVIPGVVPTRIILTILFIAIIVLITLFGVRLNDSRDNEFPDFGNLCPCSDEESVGEETQRSWETRSLEAYESIFWEIQVRKSPVFATLFGDHRFDDSFPQLSIDVLRTQYYQSRSLLNEIEKYQESNRVSSPSLSEISSFLELQTRWFSEGKFHFSIISPHLVPSFISPFPLAPSQLIFLPFFTSFETQENKKNYITRLHTIPSLLSEYRSIMSDGIDQSLVLPCEITAQTSSEWYQLAQGPLENHPLSQPFRDDRLSWLEEDQEEGQRAIEEFVIPAFRDFIHFWNEEYQPHCCQNTSRSIFLFKDPSYPETVQRVTRDPMIDPFKIHLDAQEEIGELKIQMTNLAKEFPLFESKEQILSDAKNFYQILQVLFLGQVFSTPSRCPVRFVPFHLSSNSSVAYIPPDYLCTRSGVFLVNTDKLLSKPRASLLPLLLSSLVPGQHYMRSVHSEMNSLEFFDIYYDSPLIVDGWALHSIQLGLEFLPEILQEIGESIDKHTRDSFSFHLLAALVTRLCQAVVETGVHTMDWGLSEAADFFEKNAFLDTEEIQKEIRTILLFPGRAVAQFVGFRKIGNQKKQWKEKHTKDIPKFYEQFFARGVVQ